MSLVLFSREIRSGKTTELRQWLEKQPGSSALLMPDDEAGNRHFERFPQNERWPATWIATQTSPEDRLEIGRFQFSRSAFDRAIAFLREQAQTKPQLLAIDEVGKLELKGAGLFPALKPLIEAYRDSPDYTLILVVRTDLLDMCKEHFGLNAATTVSRLTDFRIA